MLRWALCVALSAVAAALSPNDAVLMPPLLPHNVTASITIPQPDAGFVQQVRMYIPAAAAADVISMELCGDTANGSTCHDVVQQQVNKRRNPSIMYRRWMDASQPGDAFNKRAFLMTFEVHAGVPTAEAAAAACDASMPDNPALSRGECLQLAVQEIEDMRIHRAWSTRPPPNPREDMIPFWEAVGALEQGIEERGHIVYDGHTAHCPQKIKFFFDVMRNSPDVTQICEIGFNAGHSALAWLVGLPHVKVLSFDLGVHPYVTVARDVINELYPGRLELVLGDSAVTVPQYFAARPDMRCNIIFVDGSHKYEPVLTDFRNMARVANQSFGHMLIADDFGCTKNYCRNVRSAWYKMVHDLRVQERSIITTEEYTHIVGGGKEPVVNGMASGIYFADSYRSQLLAQHELPLFDA